MSKDPRKKNSKLLRPEQGLELIAHDEATSSSAELTLLYAVLAEIKKLPSIMAFFIVTLLAMIFAPPVEALTTDAEDSQQNLDHQFFKAMEEEAKITSDNLSASFSLFFPSLVVLFVFLYFISRNTNLFSPLSSRISQLNNASSALFAFQSFVRSLREIHHKKPLLEEHDISTLHDILEGSVKPDPFLAKLDEKINRLSTRGNLLKRQKLVTLRKIITGALKSPESRQMLLTLVKAELPLFPAQKVEPIAPATTVAIARSRNKTKKQEPNKKTEPAEQEKQSDEKEKEPVKKLSNRSPLSAAQSSSVEITVEQLNEKTKRLEHLFQHNETTRQKLLARLENRPVNPSTQKKKIDPQIIAARKILEKKEKSPEKKSLSKEKIDAAITHHMKLSITLANLKEELFPRAFTTPDVSPAKTSPPAHRIRASSTRHTPEATPLPPCSSGDITPVKPSRKPQSSTTPLTASSSQNLVFYKKKQKRDVCIEQPKQESSMTGKRKKP